MSGQDVDGAQQLKDVTIVAIEDGVASCMDRFGLLYRISIRQMRYKGFAPAVGERWLLDKQYGNWLFAFFMGTQPTPIPGPPGTGAMYVHTQDVPSSLWLVNHGLGGFPNVSVVDTVLRVFDADVKYVDLNNLTVATANPSTGKAFLS